MNLSQGLISLISPVADSYKGGGYFGPIIIDWGEGRGKQEMHPHVHLLYTSSVYRRIAHKTA